MAVLCTSAGADIHWVMENETNKREESCKKSGCSQAGFVCGGLGAKSRVK